MSIYINAWFQSPSLFIFSEKLVRKRSVQAYIFEMEKVRISMNKTHEGDQYWWLNQAVPRGHFVPIARKVFYILY